MTPDDQLPPSNTVASYLPAKVRKALYLFLTTAFLLETVWDLIPDVAEGKLLKSLGFLGFGMAAANTRTKPPTTTTTSTKEG